MARNCPVGKVRILSIGHEAPPFIQPHATRKGARRRGELYEQSIHEVLEKRFSGYLASLWFHFLDNEGQKWCQPDGLLFDPWKGFITICEVKYQHTPRAHEQLFDIYTPVVSAAFPEYSTKCVEIVKWFDPIVPSPVKPQLCEDVARAKPFAFNVHILTP